MNNINEHDFNNLNSKLFENQFDIQVLYKQESNNLVFKEYTDKSGDKRKDYLDDKGKVVLREKVSENKNKIKTIFDRNDKGRIVNRQSLIYNHRGELVEYFKLTRVGSGESVKITKVTKQFDSNGKISHEAKYIYGYNNELITHSKLEYTYDGPTTKINEIITVGSGESAVITEVTKKFDSNGKISHETKTVYNNELTTHSKLEYSYDGPMTAINEIITVGSGESAVITDVTKKFDSNGKISHETKTVYNNELTTHSKLEYTYDGPMTEINEIITVGSGESAVITDVTKKFDSNGKISHETRTVYNELTTHSELEYTYDGPMTEINEIITVGSGESTVITRVTKKLDSNGNISHETRTVYNNELTTHSELEYTYDGPMTEINEIITVGSGESTVITRVTKKLDSNGNISHETRTVYNNELTTHSELEYTYDGPMTEINETIYDSDNRLVGSTVTMKDADFGGISLEIEKFDANNRLVEKYNESTDKNGQITGIEKTTYHGDKRIVIEKFKQKFDFTGNVIFESKETSSTSGLPIEIYVKEFDSSGNIIFSKQASSGTHWELTCERSTFNDKGLMTKKVIDVSNQRGLLKCTTVITHKYDDVGKLALKDELEQMVDNQERLTSSMLTTTDGDGNLVSKVSTFQQFGRNNILTLLSKKTFNSNDELVMKVEAKRLLNSAEEIVGASRQEEIYDNGNLISRTTKIYDFNERIISKTEVIQEFDSNGNFIGGNRVTEDYINRKSTEYLLSKDITIDELPAKEATASILRETDQLSNVDPLTDAMSSFDTKEAVLAFESSIPGGAPNNGPRSLVPDLNYRGKVA